MFSTDYQDLYRLIRQGHIAVGFVDYRFDRSDTENPPMRDVVQVQWQGAGQIFIGARGIAYGSIFPFMCEGRDEAELFANVCAAINLAWIPDLSARVAELEAKLAGTPLDIVDRHVAEERERCINEAFGWWAETENLETLTTDEAAQGIRAALSPK